MRRVLTSFLFAFLFAASAFARRLPNIDRLGDKAASPANAAALAHKAEALSKKQLPMQGEPRLGVPTVVWGSAAAETHAGAVKPGPKATPAQAEAAARAHLGQIASLYNLDDSDVSTAPVRYIQDLGKGPIVVKMQQKIDGIEIFREEMNVVMNQQLDLVAVTGYISSRSTRPASGSLAFRLNDRSAAIDAVRDLTAANVDSSQLVAAGSRDGYDFYTLPAGSGAMLTDPVRMKKVFFHTGDGLEPAYYVEVFANDPTPVPGVLSVDGTGGEEDGYSYVISAVDGSILFRKNLSADAASGSGESSLLPGGFTYRVWADPVTGIPYDTPAGNGIHPKINATADGVQYPFVPQNDVTLPSYTFSMNDPWLAAGATQTTGNNVEAFVNLLTPDGFGPLQEPPVDPPLGDHHAFTSAPGSFLYTHQPDVDAFSVGARQASITQLFYNINFLHDWYYDSGFNEVAGNAQTDNYGRGGVAGDNIKGQSEDFQSFSNANMLTPADGGRPRMRMYNFPNLANVLDIQSPALGKANIGISQTGLRNFDVTSNIVIATFSSGPTTCTITNAAALAGNIAMFDFDNTDGTGCSFSTRISRIHATSALAALMVYTSGNPSAVANITGLNAGHTKGIGVISWNNGQVIKSSLISGAVTAHLLRMADRDGSLDQQIVFHEWGHYLSNRLIGNSSGLNTNYSGGMGEGWGDFSAMMLTVRPDDTSTPSNANWNGAYALATYATSGAPFTGAANQGYYYGIRRYPYSTDMTKNPLTFQHIANGTPLPVGPPVAFGADGANNAEVHNTGEVWTTMLWECYAALLRDTLGPTPRLTFQQAQDRMKLYLVTSMKLTPVSPTMLETRDAVLAAAYATDYVDFLEFCQAFAKRGAGLNAISPDRFSSTNSPVTESYVWGGDLSFVSATVDDSTGSCDNDGVLDANESGKLTITLKNTGDQFLSATTATVTSSNPTVTIANGGNISFPASEPYGTTTASVGISLAGSAAIENLDFTINFNDPDLLIAGPKTATAYFAGNSNKIPASTATDTFEASPSHWTTGGTATLNMSGPWVRQQQNPTINHVWFGADNYFGSDQWLTSPVFTVNGGGSVNLQFDHSFGFEFDGGGNYDGGVVEMSVNGGAWTDISTAAYNGTILNYTGDINPLKGRLGFVQTSGTVHTSLTAAIAPGSTVQVRFRVGSDSSVGAAGWTIDNVAFSGVVETPFDTVVTDPGCTAATVTTLSSSANPSPLGSSLTLTANVSSLRGAPGVGSVTFYDGAASLGTVAVAAGVATLSTSAFTIGSHPLTAGYSGATGYAASTSDILNQTISKATGSVVLGSSLNPSLVGDSVMFTATVTASNGSTPTGSVAFFDGATMLGAVSLNGAGVATYSTTALAAGVHSMTASYGGNATVSSATSVVLSQTVTPATPTITPGGPTTFCSGGSVTLTSSSATGNQWYLNNSAIVGETNQQLVVSAAGSYTVVVTIGGVSSAASAATAVAINPSPDATITAPANVTTGTTGNVASVADAGPGATYNWSISNGSITAGNGTNSITFTAGSIGGLTLNVTVTTALTCPDSKSANITVNAGGSVVTVTAILPSSGSTLGGSSVTISGTGFATGATVTIGGTAATNVVVVSPTEITAKTAAHSAGTVDVVVTNVDAVTGTLSNGFTYMLQVFDPNGDSVIDPSDIFYLVSYLFTNGPAPSGTAGMLSGDANGDGVVDPADIFFVVNYLFNGGAAPHATQPRGAVTASVKEPFSGEISLGQPVRRDGRWFAPVIVTMDRGSATPQAISLRVRFTGDAGNVVTHRTAGLDPIFEVSRPTDGAIAYLAAFNQSAPLVLGNSRSAVIAEIEFTAVGAARLDIDPTVTMLADGDGMRTATVGNHALRLTGTATRGRANEPSSRDRVRND